MSEYGMGNEGAYLPSTGNGEIPQKYWKVIDEFAKMAKKSGLLDNRKESLEKFLNSIRHRLTPSDALPLSDVVSSEQLIEKYEASANKPVEHEGLYTGIKTLDKTLMGVQQQNFMVICAGTSVGKTQIANYMTAKFAEQGEKILYLALEESEQEVGDRWAKIVKNNHINIPKGSVDFLYSELVSVIKEDKYNIIPLIAAAAQLGYTIIVVDMLNNLIDTVRDENSNVFLNRIIDVCHKSNVTLLMTARLRQPLSDREREFPSMESVYGRVDLGYIVSKCLALTPLPDEGDGYTYIRIHTLKNRRKQIGMKKIFPKIRISNLLEVTDVGEDIDANEKLEKYENGMFGSRTQKEPQGNSKDKEGAF